MVTKQIQSEQHPIVKKLYKLRTNRNFREKEKKVVVPGKKMVEELSKHFPLELCLFVGDKPNIAAKEMIEVKESLLKKITGMKSPEPLLGLFPLPEETPLMGKKFLLVLDEISDPGNLGTLFRTALAFAFEGVFLTPNCVDPFNEKALRAAKGASFFLPFQTLSRQEIIDFSKRSHTHIYLADLKGTPIEKQTFTPPLLLVLSHESSGAKVWEGAKKVTIPIKGIDSLNVAISGAIFMYEMKK